MANKQTGNITYPVAMLERYVARTGMAWDEERLFFRPICKNKPGAYIKIFTGALISHNAQNHPMDVVTVAFLCSRQC